ncbi:Na+/H+ antiporter [Oleiagrimonas sp. C23AA]|uniref:Na+/H+ antiporter n=1 Tax=Oleiagrimonas sp. C23AA TaxID=2719047 RepID=UPI00142057A1|nr:Na+/H+ antiporter [Oleiagrimonas sp. C23AA]NII11379.1 Na+/H+ antiporter [Oleiagrimonas sp. C23AA]
MSVVITALVLLLTVAVSGAVLRMLPFNLPKPLVQIGLGAMLALPWFGLHVTLDPELFFLLFVPPLLFADGWRMPRREFIRLRVPIMALALGLVLVTVVCVGYVVHWLIPAVPLAVAFALGAVLSPTDAVALSAMTGGQRMPSRLMHMLEGEALMNDASGLVALKFAVAAALTGVFSLRQASISFVLIAVGGLLCGFAVTWMFARTRRWWRGRDEDPPSHVALLLLLPFAAYLLAEHLGVSGILAAVAAGMTVNRTELTLIGADTRLHAGSTWAMLEFVFNGMVFVLLGLQLPGIVAHARVDVLAVGGHALWQLLPWVAAVMVVLVLLRFAWVWLMLRLVLLRAARRGTKRPRVGPRLIAATTLGGVRGAIALAGALSLPLWLPGGAPLPARGLVVCLAAGVILCSLLLAALGLPLVLRGLKWPREDPAEAELREARRLSARAAVRRIEALEPPQETERAALHAEVCGRVAASYRQRLRAQGDAGEQARWAQGLEQAVWLAAFRAERDELLRLRRRMRINDETVRTLMRDIDLAETARRTRAAH